jgi:hypothetical protein
MTKTSSKSAARNARKSAAAPVATKPAEQALLNVITNDVPAVVETAPVETAPVAPVETAPVAAPVEKVIWADVMKKAKASFAKTQALREGTNRFVLYPLLCRDEGMSLNEAVEAIAKAGRVRKLNTVQTDLHDIAAITDRKLVRCDKGDQKRYKLAPVAPAPVAETPVA